MKPEVFRFLVTYKEVLTMLDSTNSGRALKIMIFSPSSKSFFFDFFFFPPLIGLGFFR